MKNKTLIALLVVILVVLISVFSVNIYNIYRNHRLEISYEEDEIIVFLNGHYYFVDDYEESNDYIRVDF